MSCFIKKTVQILLLVQLSMNSEDLECRSNYDAPTGEIILPMFSNRTFELNCLWTITLNSTEEISLMFLRLMTNESSLLDEGTGLLRIYDTPPTLTGISVPLWSFNTTVENGHQINTSLSRIWIYFNSKGTKKKTEFSGHSDFNFKIVYTSFSFEKSCTAVSGLMHGRHFGDLSYIGFSVRFRCDSGYRLIGSNEISCKATSPLPRWSDSIPNCSPTCPDLGVLSHVIMTNISHLYPLNSTVDFACMESYTMVGNRSSKCVLNQYGEPQWDSQTPKCIKFCQPPYFRNATELAQTIVVNSPKMNSLNGLCAWTIRTLANSVVQLKLLNFSVTGNVSLLLFDNSRINNKVLLARITSSNYRTIEKTFSSPFNTVEVKLDIPMNEAVGRLYLLLEYNAVPAPEDDPKVNVSDKGTTRYQTTKIRYTPTPAEWGTGSKASTVSASTRSKRSSIITHSKSPTTKVLLPSTTGVTPPTTTEMAPSITPGSTLPTTPDKEPSTTKGTKYTTTSDSRLPTTRRLTPSRIPVSTLLRTTGMTPPTDMEAASTSDLTLPTTLILTPPTIPDTTPPTTTDTTPLTTPDLTQPPSPGLTPSRTTDLNTTLATVWNETFHQFRTTPADGDVSIIVAGVTAPLVVIIIILGAVYVCYRKKYPVRMIMGKNFGVFTNPVYPKSRNSLSLVRDEESGNVQSYDNPAMLESNLDLSKDNVDGIGDGMAECNNVQPTEFNTTLRMHYIIGEDKVSINNENNMGLADGGNTKTKERLTTNNKEQLGILRVGDDAQHYEMTEYVEKTQSDIAPTINITSKSMNQSAEEKIERWNRMNNYPNDQGNASDGGSDDNTESAGKNSRSSTTLSNTTMVSGLYSDTSSVGDFIDEKRRTLQFFKNAESVSNRSIGSEAGIVLEYTDSDIDEVIETYSRGEVEDCDNISLTSAVEVDNITDPLARDTCPDGELCVAVSKDGGEQENLRSVSETSGPSNTPSVLSDNCEQSVLPIENCDHQHSEIVVETPLGEEFPSCGLEIDTCKNDAGENDANSEMSKDSDNGEETWPESNSDDKKHKSHVGLKDVRTASLLSIESLNDNHVTETDDVYMEYNGEEINENPRYFLRRSLSGHRTFKEDEWNSVVSISYSPKGSFIDKVDSAPLLEDDNQFPLDSSSSIITGTSLDESLHSAINERRQLTRQPGIELFGVGSDVSSDCSSSGGTRGHYDLTMSDDRSESSDVSITEFDIREICPGQKPDSHDSVKAVTADLKAQLSELLPGDLCCFVEKGHNNMERNSSSTHTESVVMDNSSDDDDSDTSFSISDSDSDKQISSGHRRLVVASEFLDIYDEEEARDETSFGLRRRTLSLEIEELSTIDEESEPPNANLISNSIDSNAGDLAFEYKENSIQNSDPPNITMGATEGESKFGGHFYVSLSAMGNEDDDIDV
ncbi:hypothetical protein ScPMuIL_012013 [Solemya velum]